MRLVLYSCLLMSRLDSNNNHGDIRTVRVALAGCGTVGTAVANIVCHHADDLAQRTGLRFEIVSVLVNDASKKRNVPVDGALFTESAQQFNATPADMVVEVIGGTDIAQEVVLSALAAGRPVVTANKSLLATHGKEVFRTARENNTCVCFEASCAGGVPIISVLLQSLIANRTQRLCGILNGTCNFILTSMLDQGKPYADALAESQRLGYAEADPSLDVGGGDSAHKLAILSSLAFGLNIDFDAIQIEGIEHVDLRDLRIAQQLGYALKSLGIASRTEAGISLRVQTMLVPSTDPLATVGDSSMAVSVVGDAPGRTTHCGSAAGGPPTGAVVVADMLDVASGAAKATFDQLRIFNDQTARLAPADASQEPSARYLRFDTGGDADALARIKSIVSAAGVRLQSTHLCDSDGAVVIFTEPIACAPLQAVLKSLPAHVCYSVLEFD